MPPRRAVLALMLLAGCPRAAPPTPPERPAGDAARPGRPVPDSVPGPDDPDAPDEPDEPDEPARGDAPDRGDGPGRPALADPGGGEALADTLRPRAGREPRTGGCEGGARRTGESWKVECNACSCGDDGQVTCTAMACKPRPAG